MAALCWAINGLIASDASRAIGAIRFNHARMCMVFVMLASYVLTFGGLESLRQEHYWPLFLSGFVGIFLGDTALFLALNRLGPRRTALTFAMNAPIAAILGWLVLGEALSIQNILGVTLAFLGLILAITFRDNQSNLHRWEQTVGALWIGVALGLFAATAQAIGSIVVRPVLQSGADPVAVSAARIGISALFLTGLVRFWTAEAEASSPMTRRILGLTALSGLIGMAFGMTFVMFALQGSEVGIVTTLSSTTPAIMLPLLWWRTGKRPSIFAWLGGGLVVAGCSLIFLY